MGGHIDSRLRPSLMSRRDGSPAGVPDLSPLASLAALVLLVLTADPLKVRGLRQVHLVLMVSAKLAHHTIMKALVALETAAILHTVRL